MTDADFESKHPRAKGGPNAGQFTVAPKAEETGIDLTAQQRDRVVKPADVVGSCPDCGNPMVGKIGTTRGGRDDFMPGSSCDFCPHQVADVVTESEPDDDGRTFEFRLEPDGTIRVTDEDGDTTTMAEIYSADWGGLNVFGVDAMAVRRAVEYNSDTALAMGDLCDSAGLYDMRGAYDIIIDRESVPAATLLAQTEQDVQAFYEQHIGPGIDRLEVAFDPNGQYAGDSLSAEARDHVRQACAEAGLGSMVHFYSLVEDREVMTDEDAMGLNAAAVEQHYERHIGPAIDRLEDRLLAETRASAVDRGTEATYALLDDLKTAGDPRDPDAGGEFDTETLERALAAANSNFHNRDDSVDRFARDLEALRDEILPRVAAANGYDQPGPYAEWKATEPGRNPYWEKRLGTFSARLTALSQAARLVDFRTRD